MKRTTAISALLVLAFSAFGQEDRTTLDRLINSALERNPKLKAAQSLAEAQKPRIKSEGALPDPVIGLSFKNMGLKEITIGEEVMSGVGISFSQAVPFPGKLALRSKIAETRAAIAAEDVRTVRLSLLREVKELYAQIFFYKKSIALLEKKKSLLEKALRFAETKYAVGRGAQPDIFKGRVEISMIEEMIVSMSGMVASLQANLNSLLDYPGDRPWGELEEIPFYEFPLELSPVSEAARRDSPILKAAGLMVEEGEREVEMAQKEFYPNFMIQAGKDFKGRLPDMYEIMVGVEIPLYAKKKQAPLLESSRARLTGLRHDLHSMKNEVDFMVNENFVMAETAEDIIRLYREKILPQAELAVESSLANYQVDKVDFLMLLSDINSLYSYQSEYFRNLTNLWTAAAKIEELTSLEILK
jgi:outer membrane protein TolC